MGLLVCTMMVAVAVALNPALLVTLRVIVFDGVPNGRLKACFVLITVPLLSHSTDTIDPVPAVLDEESKFIKTFPFTGTV